MKLYIHIISSTKVYNIILEKYITVKLLLYEFSDFPNENNAQFNQK